MGPYKTRFHFGQSYAKMIPIGKCVANAWPMCNQSCAKIKPVCPGVANVMPQVCRHTDMLRFRHCVAMVCQSCAKVMSKSHRYAKVSPRCGRYLAKVVPTLCQNQAGLPSSCQHYAEAMAKSYRHAQVSLQCGPCFAKIVPK